MMPLKDMYAADIVYILTNKHPVYVIKKDGSIVKCLLSEMSMQIPEDGRSGCTYTLTLVHFASGEFYKWYHEGEDHVLTKEEFQKVANRSVRKAVDRYLQQHADMPQA